MAKVKDIAMQIRGVSYHPEDLHDNLDEDSVVLLRANNIKDGKLILDDVVYVSKSKVAEQQYLQTGDILICASSGSKELVGKAAFVASVKNPMTFGAFCKVVRPQPEYSEYLGHYFNSPVYRRKISALSAGANINNIKNEHIDNLDIQLVDEKERREIITILNELNMLISLRKQQLFKLDELVKARFVEMFGDSVANTKNFPSTTLETVMTVFPQNGLYKPQTDYVQDDTGIPILRIDAFYNGKVTNWNTLKRLICSETEIDRYLLRENDIVINRVNSIEYLGKCAHIVGLKEKTVFESNMMRFHMDEKKVNAVYVTEVLCTEDIYRQILRRAKKSVNQASINQEDVKSLEILVPPLSLQNQFAAFVERVDQQKQTVQQSLEKLELMKKALMQEYFG